MVTQELRHTHILYETQTHKNITCISALVRVTYQGYPLKERSHTYVRRLERTQRSHQLTPLENVNNVKEKTVIR